MISVIAEFVAFVAFVAFAAALVALMPPVLPSLLLSSPLQALSVSPSAFSSSLLEVPLLQAPPSPRPAPAFTSGQLPSLRVGDQGCVRP